jgi:hypothetical protein
MNKRTFLATAARVFAATTFVSAAQRPCPLRRHQTPARTERMQGRKQRLQGQNACKGRASPSQDGADCTAKGGKVM